MSEIIDWTEEHVRPYISLSPNGPEIDLEHDGLKETISKVEDRIIIGIQLEFEF